MFLRGVFLQLYAQLKLKHGGDITAATMQKLSLQNPPSKHWCEIEVFRSHHQKLWSRDHGIWPRRI